MSEIKDVQIEQSWKTALAHELEQPYFAAIKSFLVAEKAAGKNIYPPAPLIFNAFNKVPIQNAKVVILGQDPYHGAGEAHGHSFSVPFGIKVPPSLKNIYKELETDLPGFVAPKHGNLEAWAEQGVLMLNAYLTVEEKKPGSHRTIGWERFTDAAIKAISEQCSGVVFMLWGKPAQAKANLVDKTKHLILEAAHPSPLAGGKFFGSRPFSQANAYLQQQGKQPIDWNLPNP
jgi:uracil-DNA glycosylase